MSETLEVVIKSSNDMKYLVKIESEQTVLDLKKKIEEVSQIASVNQKLIYSGKILKEENIISFYKIQSGHTIHLVNNIAKQKEINGGEGTNANGRTTQNTGIPTNMETGIGTFDPFVDMNSAGYSQILSSLLQEGDGRGGIPDLELLSQTMSNTAFQQSVNAMLSNPQMLDYIINQNPQLRAMGPQIRDILQSLLFKQMLMNPQMMKSLMDMRLNTRRDNLFTPAFPSTTAATNSETDLSHLANPLNNEVLQSLLSTFLANAGSTDFSNTIPNPTPPQNTDTRPVEERFESQLILLNEMGFYDFDKNIEALRRSGGNVQVAIDHLLSTT